MGKVIYIKSTKTFDVCIVRPDPETGRTKKQTLTTRGSQIEDVLDHFQKLYPDAISIAVEAIDGSEKGKYHA